MTTPSDNPNADRRSDRRERLLLARQNAAVRRRRSGVAVRPPQSLPLTLGSRIVGKLGDAPLSPSESESKPVGV